MRIVFFVLLVGGTFAHRNWHGRGSNSVARPSVAHHSVNSITAPRSAACTTLLEEANSQFYANEFTKLSSTEVYYLVLGLAPTDKCQFLRRFLVRRRATRCMIHCRGSSFEKSMPKSFQSDPSRNGCPMSRQQGSTSTRRCSTTSIYRTFDGSCNNLQNPTWGMAKTVRGRLLPSNYANGTGAPRMSGCGGQELPDPRAISLAVHRPMADQENKTNNFFSFLNLVIGAYLVADITHLKPYLDKDGEPPHCCNGICKHPECFPIVQKNGEPFPTTSGCMNFVRSVAKDNCNGTRSPVNFQTSFIDLSHLYGISEQENRRIRTFTGGKLILRNGLLPPNLEETTCKLMGSFDRDTNYCPFASSSIRVIPVITTFHTLFTREHNRIADGLAAVNPHWGDERLFQEARRILIAQWQNIIFNEWLIKLISVGTAVEADIGTRVCGFKNDYNANVDPSVFVEFTTAAMRFGHAQLPATLRLVDANFNAFGDTLAVTDLLFNVASYFDNGSREGVTNLLRLFIVNPVAPGADPFLETDYLDNLFRDGMGGSYDLASLNIQRGRDHGLPTYNQMRAFFNRSVAATFADLENIPKDIQDRLAKVYQCPDDIDLFTGGLAEDEGEALSLLHFLFGDIVTMQMKRLRTGDRLFFENREAGFTEGQLNHLRQLRLSNIICDNTSADKLPRWLLVNPLPQIPIQACSDYTQLDFELWREIV
ncbi:peroxidase-like [Mya arenaria]|uniref:peroxidase-like n=1 Tax=Mya arenaria TaxID=6604 RepID=UPI0022E76CD1|nr:peroxidase-like [Mya arenaria]